MKDGAGGGQDGKLDSHGHPKLDLAPPREMGTYDGGGTTPCHTSTCQTATETCVRTNLQTTFSYVCKSVPQQCLGSRTCVCLAKHVCIAPCTSCAEGPPGSNLMVCS